jgi:hypothetical protein
MRTDALVNIGSSKPSGATKTDALVASPGSATADGREQHRYSRYHPRDASPAISSVEDASRRSIGRWMTIVVTCLIEGILILGLIVAGLGVGYESHSGVGPDRPPPPAPTPAPAPPPGVQGGPFS